ncbi:hypothetical protein ACTXT7_004010 [Hymenolepis weldensis]
MADYKTIFFAIDKERNHYITIKDLEDYVKEKQMSPTVLQYLEIENGIHGDIHFLPCVEYLEEHTVGLKRWIRLFDPKGTGRITLETFCEILQEDMDEVMQQYPTTTVQQIQLLDREMSERMMEDILNETRKAVEKNPGDLQRQATMIKEYAENHYGEVWHTFIVNGSHGFLINKVLHLSLPPLSKTL